jgi:iron complex transport system substrate-binding protein/vitamin B12 transport system substrate-binding protein
MPPKCCTPSVPARLVATVDYSDYPPPRATAARRRLQRHQPGSGVASATDLVVAWQDGGNLRELERLRQLGVAVFISHPLQLDDVATEMQQLGQSPERAGGRRPRLPSATGHPAPALCPPCSGQRVLPDQCCAHFYRQPAQFHGCHVATVWRAQCIWRPEQAAPQVSIEAVVAARPQVMLAGGRTCCACGIAGQPCLPWRQAPATCWTRTC